MLNNLADRVVLERHGPVIGQAAKGVMSKIVNVSNVRKAIADILYVSEDFLAEMITPCHGNNKLYAASRIAAMMQSSTELTMSENLSSV